jgi:hypothetical protein
MKKLNLFMLLCILIFSNDINAYTKLNLFSDPHDSLLFDGANDNSTVINISEDCVLTVLETYYKIGINDHFPCFGTHQVKKVVYECGPPDTILSWEKGELNKGNKIKAGDTVQCQGHIKLLLSDGKILYIGAESRFVINSSYCKSGNSIDFKLIQGGASFDCSNGDRSKAVNVSTQQGNVSVEGTIFSLDIIEEGGVTTDLLRVYEGSVKFSRNTGLITKSLTDKGAQTQKLTKDYQDGKITRDEYMAKLKDIMNGMSTPEQPLQVKGGYQSKIVNGAAPTDPELFDLNNNGWYNNGEYIYK